MTATTAEIIETGWIVIGFVPQIVIDHKICHLRFVLFWHKLNESEYKIFKLTRYILTVISQNQVSDPYSSAITPTATEKQTFQHFAFVPETNSCAAAKSELRNTAAVSSNFGPQYQTLVSVRRPLILRQPARGQLQIE
jgi:hypothetical protein